jgi:hypothetical protein
VNTQVYLAVGHAADVVGQPGAMSSLSTDVQRFAPLRRAKQRTIVL